VCADLISRLRLTLVIRLTTRAIAKASDAID